METKEKYIETAEIKVKNLLAELYDDESKILADKKKTREKYKQHMEYLKKELKSIKEKRRQLQAKFNLLNKADKKNYEKVRKDLEVTINYVEGDRETFIRKAEEMINEINVKIEEVEKKIKNTTGAAKENLIKLFEDLKVNRDELSEKVDIVKQEAGDTWKEVKHWFIEKAKVFKEYISSAL
jgi:uncharacterized phage infection (PIP) family protein YhgE